MANIPLTIYKKPAEDKYTSGRQFDYHIGPVAPGGYTETDIGEFKSGTASDSAFVSKLLQSTRDQFGVSGATIDDIIGAAPVHTTGAQGQLSTIKAEQQMAAQAADPNLINVGTAQAPLYMPKTKVTQESLAALPGAQLKERTLVDIASSRADVMAVAEAQGGDPFTAGTKANDWLNNWWNTAGQNEYPGVTLTSSPPPPSEQVGAEQLAEGATPTLPATSSTAPNATSAIIGASGLGGMFQGILTQYNEMQVKSDAMMDRQMELLGKLEDADPTTQAELLEQQQEKWGIPEMFQQIKDIADLASPLHQQMADLQIAETAEIDRWSGLGMSSTWLQNKELEIQYKYNKMRAPIATQLNAYAAQTQGLQGNLSMANSFASQAVDAATYDEEQEYNRIKDFMDINQAFLSDLKAEERMLFDNALSISRDALSIARDDAQAKMNLMQRAAEAGAPISFDFATTSLEEATQMYASQVASGDVSALESKDVSTFTDINGVVTAVDKRTGQVLWKQQVGRPGTSSPNISVTPTIDPVTGQPGPIQIIDRDTGEVTYRDANTGEIVDPSDVRLEGGPSEYDVYLEGIFEDLNIDALLGQ